MLGGADGSGEWGACDPAERRNTRTRSSILIEGADERQLLVDAGPDLRAQLLAARVRRVDALLVTHAHADHIMGLDEVRPLNRILGKAIPAYATSQTLGELQTRFDYVFRDPTPPAFYRPAVTAMAVEPGQIRDIAGLEVQLFSQDHKVTETLGLRVGDFAYSTDVVAMPEASMALLGGLHTWVVGCFQRRPHPVHAHLDLVLQWVDRLKPRRTVLTHMGNDMDWGWLRQNLPAGIEPAYDGQLLSIPN
jgi:phosphoribosyl 1,2-cyclic phosphate phosphodiesterase